MPKVTHLPMAELDQNMGPLIGAQGDILLGHTDFKL